MRCWLKNIARRANREKTSAPADFGRRFKLKFYSMKPGLLPVPPTLTSIDSRLIAKPPSHELHRAKDRIDTSVSERIERPSTATLGAEVAVGARALDEPDRNDQQHDASAPVWKTPSTRSAKGFLRSSLPYRVAGLTAANRNKTTWANPEALAPILTGGSIPPGWCTGAKFGRVFKPTAARPRVSLRSDPLDRLVCAPRKNPLACFGQKRLAFIAIAKSGMRVHRCVCESACFQSCGGPTSEAGIDSEIQGDTHNSAAPDHQPRQNWVALSQTTLHFPIASSQVKQKPTPLRDTLLRLHPSTGQLEKVFTDAENQVTSYTYDTAGNTDRSLSGSRPSSTIGQACFGNRQLHSGRHRTHRQTYDRPNKATLATLCMTSPTPLTASLTTVTPGPHSGKPHRDVSLTTTPRGWLSRRVAGYGKRDLTYDDRPQRRRESLQILWFKPTRPQTITTPFAKCPTKLPPTAKKSNRSYTTRWTTGGESISTANTITTRTYDVEAGDAHKCLQQRRQRNPRAYNNDKTTSRASFYGAPSAISATIGREQKQKRARDHSANDERLRFMSHRRLRRRGSVVSWETATTNILTKPELSLVGSEQL